MVDIVLIFVIAALLIERAWDKHETRNQLERMSKALIARSVPEYMYGTKAERKKLETENDLAIRAQKLIDSQSQTDPERYPVG